MSTSGGRWPPVRSETLPWNRDGLEGRSSKRQRRSISSTYEASLVPAIAEVDRLPIDGNVAAHAEDAGQEIARFDAEMGPRVEPYGLVLLRSESAASSRIEQLDASSRAIAMAVLGHGESTNAALVVSNGRSMQAAVDLADNITPAAIIAMQAAILEETQPEHTGTFRDQQVWIGGTNLSPHGATFIPPHHSHIDDAIADLTHFIARDDLSPVLAHVAVAHAQFETIHPFPDGNGRTGRALAHAMLRAKGMVRRVTVPISAGLLNDLDRYFGALTDYREGDVNPIVSNVADATYSGLENARRLIDEIDAIQENWQQRITARTGATARSLAALLIRQPAVTSTYVEETLDVSRDSAQRAIDHLVGVDVLSEVSGGKRNRRWVAGEIVDALDRFAQRSRTGRRRR